MDQPVTIGVLEEALFRKFHYYTTEMIAVKERGRKLFPTLKFTVRGLLPEAKYISVLTLRRVDNVRYKYSAGEWQQNGKGEIPLEEQSCELGIASGSQLMQKYISFEETRITNNANLMGSKNMMVVQTMHKYQPILRIYRVPDLCPLSATLHSIGPKHVQLVVTGSHECTQFIAVTAYFNEKVKQLKIEKNKYAKGHQTGRLSGDGRVVSAVETRKTPSSTESSSTETSPQQQVPSLTQFSEPNFAWPQWNPQMFYSNMYGFNLPSTPPTPPGIVQDNQTSETPVNEYYNPYYMPGYNYWFQ